jgi:hypothetical protein
MLTYMYASPSISLAGTYSGAALRNLSSTQRISHDAIIDTTDRLRDNISTAFVRSFPIPVPSKNQEKDTDERLKQSKEPANIPLQ